MTLLIVKSTLAMMAALLAVAALRRSRASLRHFVLAALFGFLLLLPVVEKLAPRWRIEVNDPVARRLLGTEGARSLVPAENPRRRTEAGPDFSAALTAAWLGGSALLGWLALGVVRLRRMAARGEVWLEGTASMNAIALAAGIRRPALVLLSEDVQVPLTFGFRRSTIVLPRGAAKWSEGELARALRHELEHVRREDWMLQLVARAACAVYWIHPLSWWAWRRFCLEAERACDDAVVGIHHADAYAGQLVSLARGVRGVSMVPALGMAGRSRLAHRIQAILDPLQPRGPHGRLAGAAVLATVLALLVSVAPAQLVTAAVRRAGQSPLAEALVKAAEAGDTATVKQLLNAGVDVNAVHEGDGTALIGAARSGDLEMMEFLLGEGADVNLAAPGDGNPLIQAAKNGHVEAAGLLLDRGARIDDVVPGDENALITAAGQGQGDIVRMLIERGADVSARVVTEEGEVRTALRMARRNGVTDVEQMLIAAGARE